MSVKDVVLKILEENKGEMVSGQAIAAEAGASRAAVWKAITQLRKEGHLIDASTNRGYCLSSSSDLLSQEGIHSFCRLLEAENIHCYKSVDSTNNMAKRLATESSCSLSLIVSETQTAGRGRMGRSFYSPDSSGIYMSLLIRPDFDSSKSILVTTAASVAVCRAIESLSGIQCQIKWVNDIYLEGRKIGGILTEGVSNFETGQVEHLVIGIGINYSTPASSFPEDIQSIAGSLFEGNVLQQQNSMELPSRNQLIGTICSQLLQLLKNLNPLDFMEEYKSRSLLLGHPVSFVTPSPGGPVTQFGKAIDINPQGGLVVLLEDGTESHINSGEVTLRKL